jgi:hypothetical protein
MHLVYIASKYTVFILITQNFYFLFVTVFNLSIFSSEFFFIFGIDFISFDTHHEHEEVGWVGVIWARESNPVEILDCFVCIN